MSSESYFLFVLSDPFTGDGQDFSNAGTAIIYYLQTI